MAYRCPLVLYSQSEARSLDRVKKSIVLVDFVQNFREMSESQKSESLDSNTSLSKSGDDLGNGSLDVEKASNDSIESEHFNQKNDHELKTELE